MEKSGNWIRKVKWKILNILIIWSLSTHRNIHINTHIQKLQEKMEAKSKNFKFDTIRSFG